MSIPARTRYPDDPRLSPDCDAGKHTACTGGAWDITADAPTACTCDCHDDPRSAS